MEKLVALVILTVIAGQLYFWQKRRKEQQRLANVREQLRYTGSHTLTTDDLIQIPGPFIPGLTEGYDVITKTFGILRWFLLVFDERDNGWIGPISETTLRSLHEGQYTKLEYSKYPINSQQEYTGTRITTCRGRIIRELPNWLHPERDAYTKDFKKWCQIYTACIERFGYPPNYTLVLNLLNTYFPPEVVRTQLRNYEGCLMQK